MCHGKQLLSIGTREMRDEPRIPTRWLLLFWTPVGKYFQVICVKFIGKMNEKDNFKVFSALVSVEGIWVRDCQRRVPRLSEISPCTHKTHKPQSQSGYLHEHCSQNTWFQALPLTLPSCVMQGQFLNCSVSLFLKWK